MIYATINYPSGHKVQYDEFKYPGGEVQTRLLPYQAEALKTVNKVHVVAKIKNGDILPIIQLIDAIRGVTDADIVLILPYLPYGRADRRFVNGDCNALAVFGRILNTMAGVEVVTLDVHNEEAAIRCIRHFTNVSPDKIIRSVIYKLDGTTTYGAPITTTGVLLPDEGAAKRYGFGGLHATKVRDPLTGKLSGFTVPCKEDFKCDNILIVDDICDGGGTFIGIADELKDYGLPLYLYVSHGIFSKGFDALYERFDKIFTTDSFGMIAGEYDKLTVMPSMGLILDAIADRPAIEEKT